MPEQQWLLQERKSCVSFMGGRRGRRNRGRLGESNKKWGEKGDGQGKLECDSDKRLPACAMGGGGYMKC